MIKAKLCSTIKRSLCALSESLRCWSGQKYTQQFNWTFSSDGKKSFTQLTNTFFVYSMSFICPQEFKFISQSWRSREKNEKLTAEKSNFCFMSVWSNIKLITILQMSYEFSESQSRQTCMERSIPLRPLLKIPYCWRMRVRSPFQCTTKRDRLSLEWIINGTWRHLITYW